MEMEDLQVKAFLMRERKNRFKILFVTYTIIVRVLSLRSSVIHAFVTALILPSCPRFHVSARLRVCSSRALSRPRALFHVGAWCSDPGTHVLSFGHVTGFGHSRSIFCHCVSARSRVRSAPRTLVHVCFVVLHAVRVSIGWVHSCYILCCVARSLDIHWLRAFMLSCLV